MVQRSYPSSTVAIDDAGREALGNAQRASGVAGTPADPAPIFADSTGQQVKIRAGLRAWVRGRVWESDPATDTGMAVPPNGSGLPRTDRFVLRLYRSSWNVLADIVTGTPSASPQPPALTQDLDGAGVYEIPLARWTVANGFANVAAADVVNEAWYPQPSGLVACRSTTRPYGNARTIGRPIYEYDTGQFRRWDGTDWTFWRPRGVLSATSTTLPTGVDRVPGQVVYEADTDSYVNWNGTAWVTWPPPPATSPSGTDVQVFQPVVMTPLTQSGSATAGTSFTTGTAAPVAGSLVLVHVVTVGATAHTVSLAGLGLTWTAVDTFTMQSQSGGRTGSRCTVFTAQCGATAPTSGSLTITATASVAAASWVATQIVGHDPVNPIRTTTVSNSAGVGVSPSVTFPAATVPGSRQYAVMTMATFGATYPQQNNWHDITPLGTVITSAPGLFATWRPAAYNAELVSVVFPSSDYCYARGYEIAPQSLTWTKPTNAKSVDVVCIGGGGGGGGGGGSNATTPILAGSCGGSAGGMTIVSGIAADNLPSTVPVTPGSPGPGGWSGKTAPQPGGAGFAGTPSWFGSSATTAYAYAVNGQGGATQSSASNTAALAQAMFSGGYGAKGGDTTATATSYGQIGGNASGPGGGGSGGALTASGANPGGPGGYSAITARIAQPGSGANGIAGYSFRGTGLPGSGGSGADSGGSSGQDGASGAPGGWYGGGGGGAGAWKDTTATRYAGRGGLGGPGVVVVITHY